MDHFAVYRIYNGSSLLYVGMSTDVFVRLEQHVKRQPWWSEVTYADVEWYGSYSEMVDAEMVAIRTESPRYNVQSRGGRLQRRETPPAPTPVIARTTFRRDAS